MDSRAGARPRAIEAADVSVEIDGRAIVHRVDFEVAHGEIFALIGPNGAGKSTLLRAVCGLQPCSGRVRLGGVPIEAYSVRERAKRLSLVSQHTILRSALPVSEVVAQGRYPYRRTLGGLSSEDRAAIEDALVRSDTARLADRPFTALSYGEQRRAILARGLATGARVLCLDEPTAALDVGHALELYALLRRLASSGYAIVAVLHQLDDVLCHADRALLLHGGRRIACGKPGDVLTAEAVRDVYGVELRLGSGARFELGPGGASCGR